MGCWKLLQNLALEHYQTTFHLERVLLYLFGEDGGALSPRMG